MKESYFSQESKEKQPGAFAGALINIDEDIQQFGGTQKYVCLSSGEGIFFGTSSYPEHLDIKSAFEEKFQKSFYNKGGGFLNFHG